jgi:hypothetical protein
MTAALVAGLCGACRESDCECCDLLVWGGPCDCGCPLPDPVVQVPLQVPALLIVLNQPQRYLPFRGRRTHCQQGHRLHGKNIYMDSGTRRCRICRQASWRNYHRKQRNGGQIA